MNLRTLVVDDETLARNRLRKFLEQEPGVEVIGECENGPEAIECIRRDRPGLVFLDVQMPEINGLDVVRALPAEHLPAIIFVTAHDRHAVEAFAVEALDYLLKPFSRERLQAALRRARIRLQDAPQMQAGQMKTATRLVENNSSWLTRFVVKEGNQMLFVKTQEVDYIEAAANYAVLCTPKGNHVLRETLRNLEASLSPALFVRISRSIIVNVERIKAIRLVLPGEWQVILHGDRELQMTRGLKEVQERLQYSTGRPSPENH
ncbi:MAG: LytTR family DNA-binding domain-containing protein [Limisphaerales bacterium]